jgi:NAD(P)H-nitrite reductase large subunit
MRKANTFVIIGNSAAGLAAIEAVREQDKGSKIINISCEPYPRPYSRCLLSYYLSGSINKERIWIRPESYYKDLEVEPILGIAVTLIDEKNKKIRLSNNRVINYDKLLFATGASPKRLNIKGIEKKGVFYLRTLEDADRILAMLNEVKDVAVLGGGLIGIRAATSLSKQAKAVQIVVKSSHVFSQILDFESADMIRRHLQANGIKILTGLEAVEILGKDRVNGVLLDDGTKLECQLIIIGKGVLSNVDLLKGKVKINEGILVDERLRTSDESIYAAGDVIETLDVFEERTTVNAIWPIAVRQGKSAGLNMAGRTDVICGGSYGMNSIDFFGMSCISFGVTRPKTEQFDGSTSLTINPEQGRRVEELTKANFSKNIYRKIVLKDNKVVGAVLVNDIEKHGVILNLALEKVDVSDIKDILVDEYFDYGKIIPLIKRQKDKFKRPEYQDTCLTYSPSFE